jgi:hypothetical protein
MAIKVSLGELTLNFEEPFSEAISGIIAEHLVPPLKSWLWLVRM